MNLCLKIPLKSLLDWGGADATCVFSCPVSSLIKHLYCVYSIESDGVASPQPAVLNIKIADVDECFYFSNYSQT
jgi:hypothetical protein